MAMNALMMIKACRRITLGARVAAFGYPDIIATPERVADILKDKLPELKYRDDSEAICKRHFGAGRSRPIPDAHSFFSLRGATLDVYDIVDERDCEIYCDLNKPMAVPLRPYDIVLDVGTLEHCFNIAQAAFNMADMVAEGGAIFHENPANWMNHGFYGMNPTWYADFYGANGFRIDDLRILPRSGGQIKDVPHSARFTIKGEANIYCCAVRKEVRTLVYPVQRKYQKPLERAA